MENKKVWITIGVAILLVAVVAVVYSQRQSSIEDEAQAIEELSEALDKSGTPSLDVPESALGEGVPELNPVDQANPFKYNNPFE